MGCVSYYVLCDGIIAKEISLAFLLVYSMLVKTCKKIVTGYTERNEER